jgi:hypothetical protein
MSLVFREEERIPQKYGGSGGRARNVADEEDEE